MKPLPFKQKKTFKDRFRTKTDTSWNRTAKNYGKIVEEKGHYFHQHVVIPGVLRLMALTDKSTLLDVACGQGVLARHIPKKVVYCGIDAAASLIDEAQKRDSHPHHRYYIADATRELPIKKDNFSHASIILSLQNIADPRKAILNIARHIAPNGVLMIVINHPCFRIPRQSAWGIDENSKIEYRRVNRYMSQLKIPINMEPGRGRRGELTWTFHFPLSSLSQWLLDAGFAIEKIEEWVSDKVSEGSAAKMENRARNEFPLFMAIKAFKK